jgi:hypothetical protein
MEMCRFSHSHDPEYLKVKRTILTELEGMRRYILSLERLAKEFLEIEKWKETRFIRKIASD